MQHWKQKKTTLAIFFCMRWTGPSPVASMAFSHLRWMYMRMALMILMTAIIKLPKAAVPAWYHVACRAAKTTVELPIVLRSRVK